MTRREEWMRRELRGMVDSRYKETWGADVRIRRAFRGRPVMEISSLSAVDDAKEFGIAPRTVSEHIG